MDSCSDISRYDLDSIPSTDTLHLMTDEFRHRHVFTPDSSTTELSQRVTTLELENESLRVELANLRVELNAKIAANQGLKDKITELYIEVQENHQERIKLENVVKNAKDQATAAESMRKWYTAQIHSVYASKNTEVETYKELVNEKNKMAFLLTTRYQQSNAEFFDLTKKFQKERQQLKGEIEILKIKSAQYCGASTISCSSQAHLSSDLTTKLETTETQLRDTTVELQTLKQHLLSIEVAKASLETTLAKHKELISAMKINLEKCEMEKDEHKNHLNIAQIEISQLKSENVVLQSTLLCSNREHNQVESAIVQLKSRLNKMIVQHRLLKSKNAELESKVSLLEEIQNENQTLRSRSFEANRSMFKKLRETQRKIKFLEEQLGEADKRKHLSQMRTKTDASLQQCLRRALHRNKELAGRLKSMTITNTLEESIDEGYGDGCAQSIAMDFPSPAPLNPRLMRTISHVLTNSDNLLSPLQIGLDELCRKLKSSEGREYTKLLGSSPMSPASPQNNSRSVA
ncbi:coiled-coil domain-containing protein 158-like [Athalia rosae]|uniref:coiled-coil domain-containing protein 158-like n=1 Tax=Athalia rosae TaxID=37344 RepID=UPI002033DB5E|nr:coiled-coil domain-containing protein 158-like [Athalia rosae]